MRYYKKNHISKIRSRNSIVHLTICSPICAKFGAAAVDLDLHAIRMLAIAAKAAKFQVVLTNIYNCIWCGTFGTTSTHCQFLKSHRGMIYENMLSLLNIHWFTRYICYHVQL